MRAPLLYPYLLFTVWGWFLQNQEMLTAGQCKGDTQELENRLADLQEEVQSLSLSHTHTHTQTHNLTNTKQKRNTRS